MWRWGSWRDWVELLRIPRPVGYWLLLWPTWIGLFAAPGRFQLSNLVVFTLGVFLMRSAGCVINDFADRRFDPHVARTASRPIAAGRIAPQAAIFGFSLMLLAAALLLLWLPKRVIALALIAAALAAIYPFTKRWWHFPQLVLGIAFGWGGLMAWVAEGGMLGLPTPWLWLAANVCWTMAYDTAYALADREDDAKIGVRSTALYFGPKAVGAIAAFALAAILLWAAALFSGKAHAIAWAGWLAGAGVQLRLAHQLLREGESAGMRFFLRSHWAAFALALGLALEDLVASK